MEFNGRIRSARPEDAARIAEIWHEGWGDGHVGHVPDELYEYRTGGSFLPRVQARIATTRVAEGDGAILGFTTVDGDEVEQVFVDRSARGTGVALELLRDAEAIIRGSGHRRAWLAVVEGNARARAFYERAGWSDTGPFEYRAEIPGGKVDVPTRRYERDLES
ncbi:GNAT family N-acetyltransferase [Glycomyces salinus]|uniref:GNAT family N-acetyltransferase n=1 Tax=Glycomyces salinus TaxID=980294 RepID=UPI0018EBB1C7|nr:GNAT family N-acetyltransferase [Glycomyces salinus]